jgi:hypothetical protein
LKYLLYRINEIIKDGVNYIEKNIMSY